MGSAAPELSFAFGGESSCSLGMFAGQGFAGTGVGKGLEKLAKKIALIVGSLREDSINLKLAKALKDVAPADFEFDRIELDDLPPYNQDQEADMPQEVVDLKRRIEEADGVLFVTPEYNRSIPGVLKNAIDWASRPYGQSSFSGKPTMVSGASIGAIGTAAAQQHLRDALVFTDAYTMAQPEVFIHFTPDRFEEDGTIKDESTREFLSGAMQTFSEWIDSFSQASA